MGAVNGRLGARAGAKAEPGARQGHEKGNHGRWEPRVIVAKGRAGVSLEITAITVIAIK